jgi:ABC transporter substrate binding protein (PQQ-dependent alcohol dehydrogenase system)
MAARIIGEAATRKNSGSFSDLEPFIKSPEFALSAFKGVRLSLRDWNGQLRQPVPILSPKLLVSVSPQPGFLHQFTELDTLGVDKPETRCKAYTQ